MVLGEERTHVADEGLGGAEEDNQVVAHDLAEIRIERGGELELAAGLPEDVGATLEVAAAADVVVQARHVRRDRQQRLAVHRHLERLEIRQEARLREAGHRPRHALAGGADDAVDVDAERAMAIAPFAHRRDVPGDQHLRRPAVGVVAGRVSPVAVPVLVELALVGDHGVVYAVGRTDGEVVAGAAVAMSSGARGGAIARWAYAPSGRWPSLRSRIGAMYQGISISADQPSASLLVACRQLPSQSLLNWLSLVTTASYTPSVELTVKL